MKHFISTLSSLIIVVGLNSFSCKVFNPVEDFDPEGLEGSWIREKKIVNSSVVSFYYGDTSNYASSDTTNENDSSEFLVITQDSFSLYQHNSMQNFYTKRTVPYELAGRYINGDTFFAEYIVYSEDNFFLKKTSLRDQKKDNFVLQYYEERKSNGDGGLDGGLHHSKTAQLGYYERFSGIIPPPGWPDSMVVIDPARR